MNKNRLMAAGSLLAIGAMFPLVTAALTGATAPPKPVATATASATATATPKATATATPSATATPAATPDCANLQPGDAWAGVSLHCGTKPTPKPTPTPSATTPATAPGTVPAPSQTAPKQCQEDDPCWDCRVMGNKLCGVEPSKLEDAWASFDAEAVAGVVGKAVSFGAVYVGTSAASSLPAYWVVPSLQYPNTFHVFMIQVGE